MAYVFLIHPNAQDAAKASRLLEKAGLKVYHEAGNVDLASRVIKKNPPAAAVIYLTEQSEEGMEAAESLKKNRATERVPLVFVGGSSMVVRNAQSRFEEAYFVEENELAEVLGWIMEG